MALLHGCEKLARWVSYGLFNKDNKTMKKGPDPILILVLVFVIGFVITGVSKTEFTAERQTPVTKSLRG